ncbi:MAG TPA: CoA ester lyase [Xanthobacteraceae bacterium]|nr:CoA ester lyase [Xanthobacteraceae bacterium]
MIRSLLYVPASSERFVAKAHERGADAIILDLEDAVAPREKGRARAALTEAVPSVGRNGAKVFVRINALSTGLALDDAQAACRAGAFGLFVAKVQGPSDLQKLGDHLDRIERAHRREHPVVLVPMLEDPGAILDARAIAAASRRSFALVSGSEDLATALGGEPTPEVLRLPKLLVHLAAKAAGLRSFGMLRTVADFKDAEAVARSAREARAFGFDGASCIHPSVVPILNAAFSPTREEIERARRMVAAFEAAKADGRGAFLFDGKMVDEPVVERARQLLARASDQ